MQKEYLDPGFLTTLKITMKNVGVEGGKSILFIARIKKICSESRRPVENHVLFIDPVREYFTKLGLPVPKNYLYQNLKKR